MAGDIEKERQSIISMLIRERMNKGISQAELAEMIGTKRSNICRIESGSQNISLDMLLKIAHALGNNIEMELTERSATMQDNMYSLRLYDEELARFSLTENGIEGLQAEDIQYNKERLSVFPIDLELTSEGIVSWLRSRVIPKNRTFVDEVLKTLGLSVNDTKGIIDVCKGLSLNDSYWVVPADFDGKFSEYNLYENRFSEVLSLVAYTGIAGSRGGFTTSPELTTNGMLRKAWRFIDDDGIYLYKGGTTGASNTGNEPYSEYYASQIAEAMGLNAVHYDLENWKGILASKCKLFTDIDTAYIPIYRIVKSGGIKGILDYYENNLGEESFEQLKSMLVFDALIYNEDRHFGNFGVLRDNRTGKIIGAAPIFDNGLSLFNYATKSDLEDLSAYAKTRSTPYGVSFENICKEVMGAKQRAELRRVIGFKFERHPSLNLPEERLISIEKVIDERVRELLSLSRTQNKDKQSKDRSAR